VDRFVPRCCRHDSALTINTIMLLVLIDFSCDARGPQSRRRTP
jgi:hypothetical protein